MVFLVSRQFEFPPEARPEVEVLSDVTWYPAELHSWSQPRPGGTWYAKVTYWTGPAEGYIATLRSGRVRKAEPPTG